MHGTGNDYLYFDCFGSPLPEPGKLARLLSDRHRSVGGDGIILISESEAADAEMRIFNADGSEGKMCGNGIRCVGKFLYEIKGMKKDTLFVQTLSGVKTLYPHVRGGKVCRVTVDMGLPEFSPESIPARFQGKDALHETIRAGEKVYSVSCLSMGNPHCVVFCGGVDRLPLGEIGPLFERHEMFPEGVNTEFVEICGENELKMRVYERGSMETLACGTGACAAAVAAVENGFAQRNVPIEVHLKGGDLSVNYGKTVLMTGDCVLAFSGTVEI